MKKDLYDIIEDFHTLRLELSYQLKANKCLIESELKEVYLKDRELLDLLDGIHYTNDGLLNRFKKIGDELLTEVMKNEKNENN